MYFRKHDVYEKPIDIILAAIQQMEMEDKEIGEDIERLQGQLMARLNQKVLLEMKMTRWQKVAETFRFKKKV